MDIRGNVIVVLLALAVGIFQSTFSTFLPSPWSSFQPAILILVAFTLRDRLPRAILFAAVAGFVADALSAGDGSASVIRFVCLAVVLSAIAKTTLTNQSLFATLALVVSARIMDWMMQAFISSVALLFRADPGPRFPSIAGVGGFVVWDAGVVLFVFLIRVILTRRFAIFSFRGKSYG